jgi:hypothetical protein
MSSPLEKRRVVPIEDLEKALRNGEEPDFVEYNGKMVSVMDLALTPCSSKEELHDWVKIFLGLDIPDCVVCTDDDLEGIDKASPFDMIWNSYEMAISGRHEESMQMYFSSRDSFKTLSAAIIEFLHLVHFRRTISHLAAIKFQAGKCYEYLQRFLSQYPFRKLGRGADSQSRTELNTISDKFGVSPYVEIITLSDKGCNSSHTNLLCVDGKTPILMYVGHRKKKKKKRYVNIEDIQIGDMVQTWNAQTGLIEGKPVINKWVTGYKDGLEVVCEGDVRIIASLSHDFHILGKGFVSLKEVAVGDVGVGLGAWPGNKKLRGGNVLSPIDHIDSDQGDFFDQVILGSLLGDGCVYRKSRNGKYINNALFREQHGLIQADYLAWKRNLISPYCNTREVACISGYTGLPLVGFSSGCNPIFNSYVSFKKTLDGLERLGPLGLAIWYMDDGCKGRGVRISTESFTKEQNIILANFLKSKFDLNLRIRKYPSPSTGRALYCLYGGGREDKYKLYQICKDHIHSTMMYKFLDYSPYYKKCIGCGNKFTPANANLQYCDNTACRSINSKILSTSKIISIVPVGVRKMYDITIKDNHNFFTGNKNYNFNLGQCLDELDLVTGEKEKGYRESKNITSETMDKKPPLTLYISTRKGLGGLVQKEIESRHETGLRVRSWNIIDVTQRCPDDKSKIGEGIIKKWFREDQLDLITPEQYKLKAHQDQMHYVEKTLYPGCGECSIAPLCMGRLAAGQLSQSSMLKSHKEVERKFRSQETDDVLSQLLCLKPSKRGLVFTNFSRTSNVVTPSQMYERFIGKKPDHVITKLELIGEFTKYGISCFTGCDYGWVDPNVALVMYIDSLENVYVVHEFARSYMDAPEFVNYIKTKIDPVYRPQKYFPDTSQPATINLMKKAELPVAIRVEKDIHVGIQTIKRYIRVPGLGISKFFILDDCRGLIDELERYSYLIDKNTGDIASDDQYEDKYNHRIDACFSEDTELLTRSGWVRINDYNPSLQIACSNNRGSLEWHVPSRYFCRIYDGDLINITNPDLDINMTADHQQPYSLPSQPLKSLLTEAINIQPGHLIRNSQFARLQSYGDGITVPPEFHTLTSKQFMSLLGLAMHYGHYEEFFNPRAKKMSPFGIYFEVPRSDQATVSRIKRLFKGINWIVDGAPMGSYFRMEKASNGSTPVIRWHLAGARFVHFMKKNITPGGISYHYINNATKEELWEFYKFMMVQEYTHETHDLLVKRAPGNQERLERRLFEATSKKLADQVQEMAFRLGNHAIITPVDDNRWLVTSHGRKKPFTKIKKGEIIKTPFKGETFCVTVPTGKVWIRRNDKIAESGNCRYVMQSILGKNSGYIEMTRPRSESNPVVTKDGQLLRVPSAVEYARIAGVGPFEDNTSTYFNPDGSKKSDKEIAEYIKNTDDVSKGGNGPGGSGFNFSM